MAKSTAKRKKADRSKVFFFVRHDRSTVSALEFLINLGFDKALAEEAVSMCAVETGPILAILDDRDVKAWLFNKTSAGWEFWQLMGLEGFRTRALAEEVSPEYSPDLRKRGKSLGVSLKIIGWPGYGVRAPNTLMSP